MPCLKSWSCCFARSSALAARAGRLEGGLSPSLATQPLEPLGLLSRQPAAGPKGACATAAAGAIVETAFGSPDPGSLVVSSGSSCACEPGAAAARDEPGPAGAGAGAETAPAPGSAPTASLGDR
eukprot:scaffold24440_cov113-Isochrysis_galbana.AAC.3